MITLGHEVTANRERRADAWGWLTVLLENDAASEDLAYEHGLSIWIETPDGAVLFDSGHTDAFIQNAARLGIHVQAADAIVISHGHYDHAGGLAAALAASDAPLYVGPGAGTRRVTTDHGQRRDIGMDSSLVCARDPRVNVVTRRTRILDSVEILPAATLVSPPPAGNTRLLRKTDVGYEADPFDDEISLLVHTPTGNVLVAGCSHRGIVNIVRDAAEVRGVVGGLHLLHEEESRVKRAARELAELGVEDLWVGHCTGDHAVGVLEDQFSDAGSVVRIRAGTRLPL